MSDLTSWQTRPRLIEWRGPNGSVVRLDEDGINLQVPKAIEQVEVEELLEIIAAAREAQRSRSVPAPAPPTREELDGMINRDRQQYTAKRVAQYIANDFREPEVPF